MADFLYNSGVWESEALILSIKLSNGQWTKATGSSLSCLSCARNVLAPTQHAIHSDFYFFFVLFYCVCSVPPLLFSMFVCLCLNLFLLCIHSSIVVSPDRNVGKYHPSDLIPSCMPPPYTLLHLTAWQSVTIALTLLYLTNTGVASHCVPSELLFTNCCVVLLQLYLDY